MLDKSPDVKIGAGNRYKNKKTEILSDVTSEKTSVLKSLNKLSNYNISA